MQLPFLKKEQAESNREYFFALEINSSTVKSAAWSVINDKPQVLSVGIVVDWDGKDSDSLVTAVDQTVSDASAKLDPLGKTEIEKVILGLPPTWVAEDKILLDKLQILKLVSDKLAIKPVGFVVTAEAITKYLQHIEGVPPTAILIGIWRHELEVALARMGKLDAIQIVKKSDSVADDVVEGLSRFAHLDMLPSRMLLYDSGVNLEQIKQALLAYPWQAPQKKLPFLHYPKIEILGLDFSIRAIALAGGSEVAKAVGLLPEASPEDLGFSNTEIITPEPEIIEPEIVVEEPKKKFNFTLPKLNWIVPVILIMVGVIGLGMAYWYVPKATVTLYLTPRTIQHQFDLPIPAQLMEVSVTADKTAPVTGTKTVGEKASGSVTIYNATDLTRKFISGTTLTTSSGLKFILDDDVMVASGSGSAVNLQLGKALVKIVAAQIGSDANLSAGTEFRVGTFATIDVVAKNDIALSGGSSKQATSVSKDDIVKLRSGLADDLKTQAKDQLLAKVSSSQTVIPESITLQTASEELSHKEGEVADDLNLKLAVKAKGFVVKKNDLEALIDQQLKSQIPDGFVLESKKSQTFTVKKTDKSQVTLTVSVTGVLLPTIDKDQVAHEIAGKYPDKAKSYLETLPAISQIDILLTPRLPESIATLPRVLKNISVEVKSLE